MRYDAKPFSVQNSKEEHQIEKHLPIMDVLTSSAWVELHSKQSPIFGGKNNLFPISVQTCSLCNLVLVDSIE